MVVLKPTDCGRESDMCQPSSESGRKRDSDPEDEFKWEEFFGTSVDLTSTLLDIYDTMVAKNSANSPLLSPGNRQHTPPPPVNMPLAVKLEVDGSAPPCDPGGNQHQNKLTITSSERPTRLYSKRSYSESVFEEKKRPLSTSSVSSSSSSSSSSLPRNGLDVKKSYLASIESLDDDDDCQYSGDGSAAASLVTDLAHKSGMQGPSSFVGAINCKPRWCDPNLSHTERVLLEIVDTEKTYVRDLEEIIQGYLEHIKSMKHPNISEDCLKELFSNIEDIKKFNSQFLTELEQHETDPVGMARCFVNNSNGFEVYTQYCTNYPRTVSVLTELMGKLETAEIFKERQMALHHNLPLGSYLLKPVQRILKYHLLLQNLVKHSDKDSDACTDIKNALCVMTGIAYHINDMKRKHEHAVRVQEIQSLLYGWQGQDLTTYGELVAEGAFRMYRAKALRHLFLFDKMLLIAKKKEEGILSYKTHIMCSDNLMLIESIPGEPLCFHVIPYKNPRDQHTFQARNLEQKREWCLQLKRVMLENYNAVIPSHARQLVMQLGQSKLEDSATEKTTSKRQLSAPEYLEKRKQERRKSEISLKRGLKLKNSAKKSSSNRRKSSLSSSPIETSYEAESWTKSQDDVNQSTSNKSYYSSSKGPASVCGSFSRDTRFRHSLPEPSLSQHSSNKERGFRQSWRAWNSVPEETTDTENEELNDSIHGERNYHSAMARSFESESFEEPYDSSGEYVTFFYAHSYATRDWPENMSSCQNLEESSWSRHYNSNATPSSPDPETASLRRDKKCIATDCHKITKDPDSESGSSGHSWKHSAALRRVQSFTGMARAKMSSLHHNISFKHHSKSSSEKTKTFAKSNGSNSPAYVESNPTSPTKWLHGEPPAQKSGSLPRSFQLTSDLSSSASDSNIALKSDNCSQHRLSLQDSAEHYSHGDRIRPFTIASDKAMSPSFSNGPGNYVFEFSSNADDDYCLLVRRDYQEPETTGCTNTPAISMENVHSIHPELKIYHQSASKYSALKQVFTSVGSKLANLRAVLSHPAGHDPEMQSEANMSMNDLTRNGMERSSSRSSIRSEGEIGHKILSAKLAHSVAKAYSAVLKHKSKKGALKIHPDVKSKRGSRGVQTYKSESSLIGARMAHPLESEYSVPKNIIPPQQLQKWKDDLRPDSMFSECSNATSSDGDKPSTDSQIDDLLTRCARDEVEDTVSEASESSADSYYERTFDAIENALTEDMFRDSAIYSDPEDADFSAVETPLKAANDPDEKSNSVHVFRNGYNITARLDLICKRPVNQAILERLRVLEENVKSQQEEAATYRRPLSQKKLDVDKWYASDGKDVEESETSSEHSASTVNTVMESGNNLGVENPGCQQSPPRIKGWVKHVVEKLQGDSRG